MRKISLFLTCLLVSFSLRAGDFKRFYAANGGERIVSLTALPGGGLWLKSQVEKGGAEINRVLIPTLHKVYKIPAGLTPLAAAAESGILMQQGETLYFRSLVKSGIFLVYGIQKKFNSLTITPQDNQLLLNYLDNTGTALRAPLSAAGIDLKSECGFSGLEVTCPIYGVNITRSSRFSLSKNGDFVFRSSSKDNDVMYLEPVASDKTLIEWGQTAEIGWAVTSVSRNVPLAPPRRLIKIFSAADGLQLAKIQIAQEAPAKGLAVAFKLTHDGPDALAVITGAGMNWWAPKAEHIDDWGEVTLDLAAAKSAE